MNKLILTAVITVAVVAGVGRVGRAQEQSAARPDFSGKWVLASSQPPGRNALGGDFSIAQDATTLRIDSTSFRVSLSTTRAPSGTAFPVRRIYLLDGTEHPSQEIADPPQTTTSAPTSGFRMSSTTEESESISKATWAGRQLVIMTYDRIKIIAPSLTPSVNLIRRTVRQALSMEANGTLVVESLIVADPLSPAHEQPSPTPVRSTYKKG
jgi:hypothetical protein